jgi:hypothetical protein
MTNAQSKMAYTQVVMEEVDAYMYETAVKYSHQKIEWLTSQLAGGKRCLISPAEPNKEACKLLIDMLQLAIDIKEGKVMVL